MSHKSATELRFCDLSFARILEQMVMIQARPRHRYTYAQYVAVENDSPIKHEFFDGEIYALAGGTEDHSALSANVIGALIGLVGDHPCRVHTSDLRIYVEEVGFATFPDAAVVCGPFQQHAPSPKATATNPTILVEVTSDSSEDSDTGAKLDAYRTIPALREYVIVSHRERRILVHRRGSEGTWTTSVAISGGRMKLETLGGELNVDAIYRGSSIL